MSITLQAIRLHTDDKLYTIQLARHISSETTLASYWVDGWPVSGLKHEENSAEKALNTALTEVLSKLTGEVKSVDSEVTCEMLSNEQVVQCLAEAGLGLKPLQLI